MSCPPESLCFGAANKAIFHPVLKKKNEQNQYFTTNSLLIASLLPFIPGDEREKVNKWVKKLFALTETDAERISRNDYVWFLLVQLESGIVTVPFVNDPPPGKLLPVHNCVEKKVYEEILEAANNRAQCQNDDLGLVSGSMSCVPEKSNKCLPSEFHSRQPSPNIGFIAYGSCFSDQLS